MQLCLPVILANCPWSSRRVACSASCRSRHWTQGAILGFGQCADARRSSYSSTTFRSSFLDLVIDRDLQVAFTRQAGGDELEVPVLLRRVQLTFLDSILLLQLRQRLAQADAHGERAVFEIGEVTESMTLFERAPNTDHAGFNKRVHASIEKMKKHSILQKIRASEERFEISPTLKLLFSTVEIQELNRLYQQMASGGVSAQNGEAEQETEL